MAKFCTQCGASLSDDTRFCTECGALTDAVDSAAPMAEEAPSSPPPPPPAESSPPPPPAQPVQPPPPPPPPPQQPVYQQAAYQQPAQPIYQQPAYQPPPAPAQGDPDRPAKGSKYEPISTGGFIGIFLLLCIPVIGLILMIVWACGGCRKVSKRAMARAMLILTAIMLVIGLIIGFAAKSFIKNLFEEVGISTVQSGKASKENKSGGLLSGLLGSVEDEENEESMGSLGALAGLLGGSEGSGGSDLDGLAELFGALSALEGMAGEEGSGDWEDILGAIEDTNQQAAAVSDGWPKSLRPYPGGEAVSVETYRTEISDTTLDEMLEWIEDLKKDGFEYQDFYDFGFTEEDMLDMNGWWAYDGETYLSVSYSEGIVTVDHTSELPDYGF